MNVFILHRKNAEESAVKELQIFLMPHIIKETSISGGFPLSPTDG